MRPFLTIVASAPGVESSEEISAISCAIPPNTTHEFRRRTSPDPEIAPGGIQPSSLPPSSIENGQARGGAYCLDDLIARSKDSNHSLTC
jgi:hypothetical protein